MSLVYKVGSGWSFTPRAESLGRLRTNYATGGYVWAQQDKDGNAINVGYSDGPNNAPGVYNYAFNYNTPTGNITSAMRNQGFRNLGNVATGINNQKKNYSGNVDVNTANANVNAARAAEEAVNKRDNNAERKVLQIAAGTKGMDYLGQRAQIEAITGVPQSIVTNALKDFKTFYSVEKLKPWDLKQQVFDPINKFDADYYRSQNTDLNTTWATAQQKDDLDILGRFGNDRNIYAAWDYTTRGKAAGRRGSAIQPKTETTAYVEKPPTDAEAQLYRKELLGVQDQEKTRDQFLAIPGVAEQWERAKEGAVGSADGEYWNNLADKEFFDVQDPNDFMLMFRISQREKDKKINKDANKTIGISALDDEIFRIETEKIGEASTKFGALARDTLKTTIAALTKAEEENARLEVYNTIPQVQEINNMASELANSIAGDYQAGGISPINKKQLTRDFQNLFGTNNNVTYNWQKFFDEEISDKYKDGATITDEDGKEIAIEKEFAEAYINQFLKPRFDTSRSMDEFESYVGERQAKQNPFDLQDYRNDTRTLAATESDKFIAAAQGEAERRFNSDFYFNPTGRGDSNARYALQKKRVNDDWAAAKANPDALIDGSAFNDGLGLGTWAQQAYKYGVDLNNKDQFGRMHYQIIGRQRAKTGTNYQFDGSDDIINNFKAQKKVDEIADALEKKDVTAKFTEFETPQELADEIIRKLPTGDAERKERLSELGYGDFDGDSIQLRELLVNDAAKDEGLQIRRKLKYLQDEGALPTQQELGYSYIERDEDVKPGLPGGAKVTATTPLFEAFQQAGFQGSEDDFYDNFMTGTSRADQELAYQISKGNPLKFGDRLTEDIGAYSRLLDTPEERGAREAKNAKTYKSYFDTYEGDDYRKYNRKKGRSFLDEYKDLFDTSSFSFSSDF